MHDIVLAYMTSKAIYLVDYIASYLASYMITTDINDPDLDIIC